MSFLPNLPKLNVDQKLDFQLHTILYLKNTIQKQIYLEHIIAHLIWEEINENITILRLNFSCIELETPVDN